MAIERVATNNLRVLVRAGEFCNDSRQIALQVKAQGQKIGNDDNPPGAGCIEPSDGSRKVGLASLEKGGFPKIKPALLGCGLRNLADRIIRRLDGRSVREKYNSGHYPDRVNLTRTR